MVTNKDKYKIKFIVANPEKEADKEASAKLAESIHNEFKISSQVFSVSCCRPKKKANCIRCLHKVWHMHNNNLSKRN